MNYSFAELKEKLFEEEVTKIIFMFS